MSNELAVREERGLAQQQRALSPMEQIGGELALVEGVDKEYQFRMRKLGTIHMGVRTNNGTGHPIPVDYFVLPEVLLKDKDFREALEELGQNPDKPRKLPIFIMSDDLDATVAHVKEVWGQGGKLKCRATPVKYPNGKVGFNCIRLNPQTQDYDNVECGGDNCPDCKNGSCVWVTKVKFVLPDQNRLGFWEIDSKSENNKGGLYRQLAELRKTLGGMLAGIDMQLVMDNGRVWHPKVTNDKTGAVSRMRTTPWLLYIELGKSLRKIMREGRIGEVIDVDTIEDNFDHEDEPIIEDYEPTPSDEPAAEQHEDAVIIAEPEPDPEQARQEAIAACKTIILALNYTKKQVAELFAGLGIPAIMKDMTQANLQTLYTDLHKKLNGGGEEEPLPTE